ncbi:PQQ-binding-like beta-propeller repeat protein [Candidatus Poribacteria bacterium]
MNNHTESVNTAQTWYRTFVWVAVVGGIFSLIVCALLISNYIQGKTEEPLESAELTELRTMLRDQPNDGSLKEQIRVIDLRLREEYFQRHQFSTYGAYLLIGGVAVFLIGIKSAFTFRKKLPMPQTETSEQEEESRMTKMSRWAMGVFALLVVCGALLLMIFGSGVQYPTASEEPVITYPTPEEIKQNWPQFRGPGGLGISAYTNVPTSWNGTTGEGVLWKTPVPLPGENSPIVWGDRVFLTGATEEAREIYCFDANSGELLWQRAVENVPFSDPEPPEVAEETGYAAPTAVADGQRVYAIFANGDIVCFGFNGNRIWARNVGPFDNMYGHASSLAMHENILIVLLDQGGADDGISEIIGIDAASGRTVWETPRPVPNSWASPIVINTGTRHEIITCGTPWVIAYDPIAGAELWRAEGLSGDIGPSPVYGGGLVFATNSYAILAAISPGGQGNATETNIVWTAEDGLPDICSPLTNGELVFLLETYGLMTCYDAQTGEMLWEEDLGEEFEASPSLVRDQVYLMTMDGVTIIFKADRQFEEIARHELGEESNASPAFLDGRIYIRGKENLYCISSP